MKKIQINYLTESQNKNEYIEWVVKNKKRIEYIQSIYESFSPNPQEKECAEFTDNLFDIYNSNIAQGFSEDFAIKEAILKTEILIYESVEKELDNSGLVKKF